MKKRLVLDGVMLAVDRMRLMRKNVMTAALCITTAVASDVWALGAPQSNRPLPQEMADTLKTDTLREITVTGKERGAHFPLSNRTNKDLDAIRKQQLYSPGGLLQKYAPTLHDQIMHPFGFAERKKSKKRKKVGKVLQQYDAIGADPLQLLLDSIANGKEK